MRDIKFRAFDKDTSTMYMQNDLIINFDEIGEDVYIHKDDHVTPMFAYELTQYTGLKDRNGTEIYEGDIIKDSQDGSYYEIDFDEDFLRFRATELYFRESYDLSDFIVANDDLQDVADGLIIGNIYENQELLK